jgi:hypothetical protein
VAGKLSLDVPTAPISNEAPPQTDELYGGWLSLSPEQRAPVEHGLR